MQPKSDNQIVEGILAHNHDILRYLYQTMFSQIETFVSKNNGSTEEAKDMFQDGLLALYQNKYQFENDAKRSSYFYQICKFKWYSIFRSSYKKETVGQVDVQLLDNYDRRFEDDNAEWDKSLIVRRAAIQERDSRKTTATDQFGQKWKISVHTNIERTHKK